MTLKLLGSSSGHTALDAPASAGSNTLVLPPNNGTVGQVLQTDGNGNLTWVTPSSNSPAFSAYASAAVDRSGTQDLVFDSEHLDTDSCYNTSTGRFTPDVAGNYLFSFTFYYKGSTSGIIAGARAEIWKNSSTYLSRFWTDPMQTNTNQLNRAGVSGSVIIPMNGSSDYVSIQTYALTTTGGTIQIDNTGSVFCGMKLA